MPKVRVYQLAKELNLSNKELIERLRGLGVEVKSHSSSIEEEIATRIKDSLAPKSEVSKPQPKQPAQPAPLKKAKPKPKTEPKPKPKSKQAEASEPEETETGKGKLVKLPDSISVAELAAKINISGSELIKGLIAEGQMVTLNQLIPYELAEELAAKLGYRVEKLGLYGEDDLEEEVYDASQLLGRAPIVTIMGHVDHGKTKLLDTIRDSDLIYKEAGGITQHTGAYHVETGKGHIVFLDTPGHEAFTAMRARGAQVTDLVILVVAADDGVMPQTVEAIDHAKAAGVPIVVAINKIDKPEANPDKVKQQLTEHDLLAEEWGGETIFVEISAKNNTNIGELLEMILLQAEMLELTANPNVLARGTVIEAKLDKGRGAVATVLIQHGKLSIGDAFVVGNCYGKVRAMFSDRGQRIKVTGPATAVEILGFNGIPQTGDTFQAVKDEKTARDIGRRRQEIDRDRNRRRTPRVTLEDLFNQIESNLIKELNVILKTDVRGSGEAIINNFAKIKSAKVKINIIHSGVGAVSSSDVMLAAASNAIIIGFHVDVDSEAVELAKREEVDVRLYDVIYNINDDLVKAMEGLLEPTYEEVITGHAEVRQLFKVPKIGVIAGSYVTDGYFNRNSLVRVKRNGKVLFEGKLLSLRRFKESVKEVKAGLECGIGVNGFTDLEEADIIESYLLKEVAGQL